jgi:hypothetical protein
MSTTSTTPVKVKANRRNSALSTGPRSEAGKAAVATNAVRHGLLSWRPVLPGMEREEDWQEHLRRTLDSLAPSGHLEEVLAERIALQLWRLDRVARYERETLSIGLEKIGDGSEEVAEAKRQRNLDRWFQAFADLKDEAAVSGADASWLVGVPAEQAEVDLEGSFPRPGWMPAGIDVGDFDGWTAGRVREYLGLIAARANRDVDRVWRDALEWVAKKAEKTAQKRDEELTRVDRARPSHLVAPDQTLEKITRYETTLERSLHKTLHELQRLQAARHGQAVPPPAVLDVDVNVGGAEG